MRMNKSDIKQEILDNWDYLGETNYPEDLLSELAESALPIYYKDILNDWAEMPNEYTDSWTELTANKDGTLFVGKNPKITNFMIMDLFNYYHNAYTEIYEQIKTEKTEQSNELETVK
jgi:hypothetical protein